ncbi:MAG: hypothetical protein AAFP92_02120 [Bacteroidota bacterium]
MVYFNFRRLFLFLLPCFLISCQQELGLPEEDLIDGFTFQRKVEQGEKLGKLDLPEGTEVWKKDIKGGKQLKFFFPDGVKLLYKGEKGQLSSFASIGYKGICTIEGGGCDVIFFRGKYGCLHTTCEGDCIGSFTSPGNEKLMNHEEMSFINPSLGISYVREQPIVKRRYQASSVLFELPEVASFVSNLQADLAETQKAGQATAVILLNIYGAEVAIEVPEMALLPIYMADAEDETLADNPLIVVSDFSQINCLCHNGTRGILAKDQPKGWALCRSGSCSDCEMKVVNQ